MAAIAEDKLVRQKREMGLKADQIRTTIELLDEENTIPFITRYRRDRTGGLDEQQIEKIRDWVRQIRQLEERKNTILRSIEAQGKLTSELRGQIEQAEHARRLDDLYLPFRPKKQTLSTKAIESGLAPLADEIYSAAEEALDLDARAADYVNTFKGVATAAEALLGAGNILAERFSENAEVRQRVRRILRKTGRLKSEKTGKPHKKADQFRDYLDYQEPLSKIPPHRVLAINRGEKAGILRVAIVADIEAMREAVVESLVPPEHPNIEFLRGCARDCLARLMFPSLEREARRELSEKAESHAVEVFARNLKRLLLQPPLPGKRVLAVDPGFRNGCKLAALDEFGRPLETAVVYLVGKDEVKDKAKSEIARLVTTHGVKVVAIGNGTACRETESLLAEMLATELAEQDISYTVVNEAGASVYSTSQTGREELPEREATERSAISIGRRLQDPLSELVKVDPASIGVGLYQHDTRAKHLKDTLDEVVQSCVSFVGVDLNTASTSILRYVSGLNQLTARRIYEHRQAQGPFKTRNELLSVAGIGDRSFTQAAGFLKISAGEEPLDATWIHPENYGLAERVLQRFNIAKNAPARAAEIKAALPQGGDLNPLAAEFSVSELVLSDLFAALTKPGRDPREDLPPPIFRKDVVKLDDLSAGMELLGTILNVVDFGAFVDIGLHDSGLVHVSELSANFVRDPHQVVAVGDQVRVWVTAIDSERQRVSLTMIPPGTPKKTGRKQPKQEPQQRQRKRKPAAEKPRRSKRPPRKPKPRTPLVPITKKMVEGKEPMRTFGDLLQFYEKTEEAPAKKPPNTKE